MQNKAESLYNRVKSLVNIMGAHFEVFNEITKILLDQERRIYALEQDRDRLLATIRSKK